MNLEEAISNLRWLFYNSKNTIQDYFTKTSAFRIYRNVSKFIRLLSNSKKFGKSFDVQMRTYSGDISIFYELF